MNKPDVIQWSDVPADMQEVILNSHARNYNADKERIRKAFTSGNPLMIIGYENKKAYTQIHPQSTAIMQVLIKQNI